MSDFNKKRTVMPMDRRKNEFFEKKGKDTFIICVTKQSQQKGD